MSMRHGRPTRGRRAAAWSRQAAAWSLIPFASLYVLLCRAPAPRRCPWLWDGAAAHRHECSGRPDHKLPHVCRCGVAIPAPPKILLRPDLIPPLSQPPPSPAGPGSAARTPAAAL